MTARLTSAPIVSQSQEPLIRASRLQVGRLLPKEATLRPAHEYLTVLGPAELCAHNASTQEDKLALKFRGTFPKIEGEAQINKTV